MKNSSYASKKRVLCKAGVSGRRVYSQLPIIAKQAPLNSWIEVWRNTTMLYNKYSLILLTIGKKSILTAAARLQDIRTYFGLSPSCLICIIKKKFLGLPTRDACMDGCALKALLMDPCSYSTAYHSRDQERRKRR